MPDREHALTPQRRETFLKLLRGGLPIDTAARLTGVDGHIVRSWRNRSTKKVPGYVRFNDEIDRAMAEGEAIHLARITDAGKTSWRASAWLLERMYPDRWGAPLPIDIPDAPPAATADLDGL